MQGQTDEDVMGSVSASGTTGTVRLPHLASPRRKAMKNAGPLWSKWPTLSSQAPTSLLKIRFMRTNLCWLYALEANCAMRLSALVLRNHCLVPVESDTWPPPGDLAVHRPQFFLEHRSGNVEILQPMRGGRYRQEMSARLIEDVA